MSINFSFRRYSHLSKQRMKGLMEAVAYMQRAKVQRIKFLLYVSSFTTPKNTYKDFSYNLIICFSSTYF